MTTLYLSILFVVLADGNVLFSLECCDAYSAFIAKLPPRRSIAVFEWLSWLLDISVQRQIAYTTVVVSSSSSSLSKTLLDYASVRQGEATTDLARFFGGIVPGTDRDQAQLW
jgi:hypothetical protein